jgi:hypothetical protein
MPYIIPAWAFIPRKYMKHLQDVQLRALRYIGGYDRYIQTYEMRLDLNYIKILASKFYIDRVN